MCEYKTQPTNPDPPLLSFGITSEASFLQKTVIALPVKDDVIEKYNANDLSRSLDLLRGVYVRRRRFETSRRVVMRDNDA